MDEHFPDVHIDPATQSVWRYRHLLANAAGVEPVDVGDGAPLVREVTYLSVPMVLWREDLCPNGSHKDRSVSVQVAIHRHRGVSAVCLSSSGNAAIAAAAACRVAGIRLVVFVSPRMALGKLVPLLRYGATVIQSNRAMALCNEFSSAFGVVNLRPSMDDLALEGYKTLAFRAVEHRWGIDAVVCYSTSGSTICGMARGFEALRNYGWTGLAPALVAAQAGKVTALAETFGQVVPSDARRSLIGDLGAKRSRRHGEVVRALRASGGGAIWVDDEAILEAQRWLLDRGVNTSLESVCAVAAAKRWIEQGKTRRPAVLLTGHYGHDVDPGERQSMVAIPSAETLADLPANPWDLPVGGKP